MFRVVMAAAVACAVFATPAHTQPELSDQARRAIMRQGLPLNSAQRAQLASRLAGVAIDPVEVTDTVSVSALSPVVGDSTAPTLGIALYRGTWLSFGPDPRAVLTDNNSEFWVRMQLAASHRHLLICDMTERSTLRMSSTVGSGADSPLALTWESDDRAAVYIPAQASARRVTVVILGTGSVRRCEVSRIR